MIPEYEVRFTMKLPCYNTIEYSGSKTVGNSLLLNPSLLNPSARHCSLAQCFAKSSFVFSSAVYLNFEIYKHSSLKRFNGFIKEQVLLVKAHLHFQFLFF